jgi:hypothetical protein
MTVKRYPALFVRASFFCFLIVLCGLGGCYKPPATADGELWESDIPSILADGDRSRVVPAEQEEGPLVTDAFGGSVRVVEVNEEKPWITSDNLPWQADYVMYLGGQDPVGFSRVDVEALGGQVRIQRSDWVLTSRDGADGPSTVWRENRLEAYESLGGRLNKFELESTLGDLREQIEGKFLRGSDDLQITTVLRQDSQEVRSSSRLKWQAGTWGSLGIQALLVREPMRSGEVREVKVFVPGMNQIATVRLTAETPELTPLAGGRATELLPIKVQMLTRTVDGMEAGTESRNWVNENGEIEKTLELTGAGVRKFRVARERTERLISAVRMERMLHQAIEIQMPPQIIWDDRLPADAVFKIEMERTDPAGVFLKTLSQHVDSLGPRSARITVRPSSFGEFAGFESNRRSPPTPEDSSPGPWIQSDHSLIKQLGDRLAKELSGKLAPAEFTPQQFAEEALRLISERIPTHALDTSPPSALNSLKDRKGDFIDHACLLTALLRYHGIPARVMCGLKVQAEGTPRLVFWMWTEAWMEDRWVGLDATVGGPVGRDYLAIEPDSLAGDNPYTVILSVMQRMTAITRVQHEP